MQLPVPQLGHASSQAQRFTILQLAIPENKAPPPPASVPHGYALADRARSHCLLAPCCLPARPTVWVASGCMLAARMQLAAGPQPAL